MPNSVHTLAAKMIFNLVETIASKETAPRAKMFLMLMEMCVDKLDFLIDVLDEVKGRQERMKKGEPETRNIIYVVEKARPVALSIYATEKPDDVIAGKHFVGIL